MTATKGLGTYGNGVGTVTPLDHKMANSVKWVHTAANTIRSGVVWDGNATVITGKANMSYDVRALGAVLSRSATSGAVEITNDAVYNVVTTAAPGSNSRYDVVYLWQREYSLDGTDSNPVIGVVQGTAAASPTVPSLAAFPGAIELGRILVPTGVTATNSGTTITQTAPFTAAAGGRLVFRTTTEMNTFTPAGRDQEALCLADNLVYGFSAGSTWFALNSTRQVGRISSSQSLTSGTTATRVVIDTTAIINVGSITYMGNPDYELVAPVAGVYRVTARGTFGANSAGNRSLRWMIAGSDQGSLALLPGTATNATTLNGSTIATLAASDRVALAVWQSSGSGLTFTGDLTLELITAT